MLSPIVDGGPATTGEQTPKITPKTTESTGLEATSVIGDERNKEASNVSDAEVAARAKAEVVRDNQADKANSTSDDTENKGREVVTDTSDRDYAGLYRAMGFNPALYKMWNQTNGLNAKQTLANSRAVDAYNSKNRFKGGQAGYVGRNGDNVVQASAQYGRDQPIETEDSRQQHMNAQAQQQALLAAQQLTADTQRMPVDMRKKFDDIRAALISKGAMNEVEFNNFWEQMKAVNIYTMTLQQRWNWAAQAIYKNIEQRYGERAANAIMSMYRNHKYGVGAIFSMLMAGDRYTIGDLSDIQIQTALQQDLEQWKIDNPNATPSEIANHASAANAAIQMARMVALESSYSNVIGQSKQALKKDNVGNWLNAGM